MKFYFLIFFLLISCHYIVANNWQELLIINESPFKVIAEYRRPDPGFRGSHVLIDCTKIIQSNTHLEHIIWKKKNNPAKIELSYFLDGTLTKQEFNLSESECIYISERGIQKIQTAGLVYK